MLNQPIVKLLTFEMHVSAHFLDLHSVLVSFKNNDIQSLSTQIKYENILKIFMLFHTSEGGDAVKVCEGRLASNSSPGLSGMHYRRKKTGR